MKKNRKSVLNSNDMKRLKDKWRKKNPPVDGAYTCWRCKNPVAEDKVSLDHVLTVEEYPEYAKELSNLKPAHVFCNQERAHSVLKTLRGRKVLKRL